MSGVVVRYAPSPTGVPHIGNIRTALYNYLFARGEKGIFILRIEDTDQKRLVSDSIALIKKSLESLGLKWDQYHQQSQRLAIYKKHLEILKEKNLVYEDGGAWRFKVPKGKKIVWQDVVHGPVEFLSDVIEDFVLIKSDGFPTYHFASVIDDHQMKITHVIRGDEWISSTPKHLLSYEAFSWKAPLYVHLPIILGPAKKKLSKREGARSILEYLDSGYLPEALVNFMALLGWAPRDNQELFTLDELIRQFSLERLNKNSPIFNIEKLNWFNKKYLQKYQTKDLAKKIRSFSKLAQRLDESKLSKITGLVRDRLTTLADFVKVASIFFAKGNKKPPSKEKIENAKKAIESVSKWDPTTISKRLDEWILKNKLDPADFKNTLRLAVFADNTPPIYQSLAILTKKEVLDRIEDALKKTS